VVYLSLIGKEGFRKTALICMERAEYCKKALRAVKGVEVLSGPTFNEFTVLLPGAADGQAAAKLPAWVWHGLALSAGLLLCFSRTLWSYATITEVYALNLLLIALILLFLFRWRRLPSKPAVRSVTTRVKTVQPAGRAFGMPEHGPSSAVSNFPAAGRGRHGLFPECAAGGGRLQVLAHGARIRVNHLARLVIAHVQRRRRGDHRVAMNHHPLGQVTLP
jgi:hypothetical protein